MVRTEGDDVFKTAGSGLGNTRQAPGLTRFHSQPLAQSLAVVGAQEVSVLCPLKGLSGGQCLQVSDGASAGMA